MKVNLSNVMKKMGYIKTGNKRACDFLTRLIDTKQIAENEYEITGEKEVRGKKTMYPLVLITSECADRLLAYSSVPEQSPPIKVTPPPEQPQEITNPSESRCVKCKYRQFYNMIQASEESINIGVFTRLLMQNGIDVSEKKMFDYLRDNGWLEEVGGIRNVPTVKAITGGYLEFKEVAIQTSNNNIHISFTPKITGKGQVYFAKLWGDETYLPY